MDLLDLAQIQKGTFKINKKPINLRQAVDNSFAVVEHYAQKKNVRLVSP